MMHVEHQFFVIFQTTNISIGMDGRECLISVPSISRKTACSSVKRRTMEMSD